MNKYHYAILTFACLITGLQAGDLSQTRTAETLEKWRIVNFWSEWCTPCRKEIPVFNDLHEQLALSGSQVTVLGVNVDEDSREKTMAIAARMGITFPTLTTDAVSELRLQAPMVLPTTYILSPDNQVVVKLIGEQSATSLSAQLAQLHLTGQPD